MASGNIGNDILIHYSSVELLTLRYICGLCFYCSYIHCRELPYFHLSLRNLITTPDCQHVQNTCLGKSVVPRTLCVFYARAHSRHALSTPSTVMRVISLRFSISKYE